MSDKGGFVFDELNIVIPTFILGQRKLYLPFHLQRSGVLPLHLRRLPNPLVRHHGGPQQHCGDQQVGRLLHLPVPCVTTDDD